MDRKVLRSTSKKPKENEEFYELGQTIPTDLLGNVLSDPSLTSAEKEKRLLKLQEYSPETFTDRFEGRTVEEVMSNFRGDIYGIKMSKEEYTAQTTLNTKLAVLAQFEHVMQMPLGYEQKKKILSLYQDNYPEIFNKQFPKKLPTENEEFIQFLIAVMKEAKASLLK